MFISVALCVCKLFMCVYLSFFFVYILVDFFCSSVSRGDVWCWNSISQFAVDYCWSITGSCCCLMLLRWCSVFFFQSQNSSASILSLQNSKTTKLKKYQLDIFEGSLLLCVILQVCCFFVCFFEFSRCLRVLKRLKI